MKLKIAKRKFPPISDPKVLAIDTECTGLNWSKDDLPFGISYAFKDRENIVTGWYDWPVDPYTRKVLYTELDPTFIRWYTDPEIDKVFANAKYDMHMLYKAFRIKPRGFIYDVLTAAWCCNTMEPSYKLNNLAEKYLKIDQAETKLLRERVKSARLKVKAKNYKLGDGIGEDYWLLKHLDPSNKLCEIYGRKDAVRTLKLWVDWYEQGLRELDVREAFEIEMATMLVIYEMEERGVRFFDTEAKYEVERLNTEIAKRILDIKLALNDPILNINSDDQLRKYIYKPGPILAHINQLPIPITKFTSKSKKPSVDTPTLMGWDNIPVIKSILEYRGITKGRDALLNFQKHLCSDSYASASDLPFVHSQKSIHPSFNQQAAQFDKENVAKTGRLTSSNPNIQNIADAEKSGGYFVVDTRQFFGPRTGYVWYCIDYSQLELRIFAERTGGKLKAAFLNGRDPHNETRENVPYLAAMEPERGRKIAKNTNFTIVNCGGASVLEAKYGVPLEEGTIVVKQFKQEFKETVLRQKQAEAFAIKNGFIKTLFGRKVNVDLTRSSDGRYLYAYRATSYDIQGSASDIIKQAMIQTHKRLKYLRKTKLIDAHLILSIHDELIFEIRKEHAYKWLIKELIWIMENVASKVMTIPLKCDAVKTSKSWSSKDKEKVKL